MLQRIAPYSALLIGALVVILLFVYSLGQISTNAYQEGLRAGKASAQATAYDDAYSQGYERGYASAMYEVSA